MLFVCRKLSRSIGVLYRLKQFLPKYAMRQLYYTLTLPHIEYCNIVWGRTSDVHLNPIKILQKRAIRIITASDYLTNTSPLFKEMNILKFDDINKAQLAVFMYKFYNNELPISLKNYFKYVHNYHEHNTRQHKHLYVERYKTRIKSSSVKIAGPKLWNSLDVNIKRSVSCSVFKRRFIKNIINNY